MIIAVSRQEAAATRRDYTSPSGAQATVDTYIGVNRAVIEGAASAAAPAGGDTAGTYPMAYLVAQAPGSTLQPHFHQADQFQVFVAGSGRIGTHPIEPLVVHFAGAHSPYGPLVAGSEGLQYLTLRRNWDPGAQWMPASAQKLRELPGRRHRMHTTPPISVAGRLVAARGESRAERLFSEGEMGAWLVELGPQAEYTAEVAVDRFVHVLSGDVSVRTAALSAGACLFASADEGSLRASAGAAGACLLLAQFDPAR